LHEKILGFAEKQINDLTRDARPFIRNLSASFQVSTPQLLTRSETWLEKTCRLRTNVMGENGEQMEEGKRISCTKYVQSQSSLRKYSTPLSEKHVAIQTRGTERDGKVKIYIYDPSKLFFKNI